MSCSCVSRQMALATTICRLAARPLTRAPISALPQQTLMAIHDQREKATISGRLNINSATLESFLTPIERKPNHSEFITMSYQRHESSPIFLKPLQEADEGANGEGIIRRRDETGQARTIIVPEPT